MADYPKIKLLRFLIITENGTVDTADLNMPLSPEREIIVNLSETLDMGDGRIVRGFAVTPILQNRIEISIPTVTTADLYSILCDECHNAGAVMSLEPIVDDEERAHGPRRPDMDVCTDCADKLLATGRWEVA